MDITKLILADKIHPVYSFLTVTWGLIADVDLESEKIRWMGSSRFTIWTILRLLKLRRYHAQIFYFGEHVKNKSNTIPPVKEYVWKTDPNTKYKMFVEEEEKALSSEYIESIWPEPIESDWSNDASLLDAVPSDWSAMKTHFTYFTLNNTPYIGTEVHNAHLASIDDGYNDLVIQRGREGWWKAWKLMWNFEKGTYFNNDGSLKQNLDINYIKIREFRICPSQLFSAYDDNDSSIMGEQTYGFYSIDGERYNAVEMQGKVLHQFLNVMCL